MQTKKLDNSINKINGHLEGLEKTVNKLNKATDLLTTVESNKIKKEVKEKIEKVIQLVNN